MTVSPRIRPRGAGQEERVAANRVYGKASGDVAATDEPARTATAGVIAADDSASGVGGEAATAAAEEASVRPRRAGPGHGIRDGATQKRSALAARPPGGPREQGRRRYKQTPGAPGLGLPTLALT